MAIERAVRALPMLCAPLVAGCFSGAIGPDLDEVRALTRAPALADVSAADVSPVPERDAVALLAQPLDLDRAVRVALLHNRELRATLREIGIARGNRMQAGVLPNPLLEVEALPERDTLVEIRVEYALTQALFASARVGVEDAELEAARFRAARAAVELGYRVRAAFYDLQAAQARLAVGQRMLDTYAAGRDAARALFEAGNVPELDVAIHEAAFERARVRVARFELEVAERREAMQRLLGLHGEHTEWTIEGELPGVPDEVPGEPSESDAIERSLALAELRARIDAAARRAGLTRLVGSIPDVAVDVHALYGRPDEAPDPEGDRLRFGGGVTVSVPLFDRREGAARAYEAELEALLERYYGMAVDVRSATRDARNRMLSAYARARHYANVIVPAQQRISAQTLLQYNAMQLGVFPLLEALREQLEAELEHIDALRELWGASAASEAILAGGRSALEPAMDDRAGRGAARSGEH